MPQVPRLENQTVQESALPGARFSTDVPLAALGGGQSLEGVTSAAEKLFQHEQEQADDAVSMDFAAKMTRQKNALIMDPNDGVMTKKGQDALGVVQEYTPKLDKYADDLQSDMTGRQKRITDRIRSQVMTDFTDHLEKHTFQESQALKLSSATSAIQAIHDDSVLNYSDPKLVNNNFEKQAGAVVTLGRMQGMNDEQINQAVLTAKSSTVTSIVERMLANGQTKDAQGFFEAHKDIVDAKDVTHIEGKIENSTTLDQSLETWNQVQGMRLSDGTPNEQAMVDSIMKRDDLSSVKKDHIADFIRSKANELKKNISAQDSARDHSFMNTILQGKQAGQSQEDAMRLVPNFSKDPYEQALKTKAVADLYAPPTQSDPTTHINLWERTYDGKTSVQDIDQARQKGLLNVSDWMSLREDVHKNQVDGTGTPGGKLAIEWLKDHAKEKYSDPVDQHAYLYQIKKEGEGKSPEELKALAIEKDKTDPKTGFFGFGEKYQWKTDMQKSDAQDIAIGTAYKDLGRKETLAIGAGAMLSQKKDSWGASDVDAFSKEFGGYNNTLPGTPVHNAVQSLMRKNWIVTPKNVKWVLEQNKDGNL